jgi:hypothetical protein
VTIPVCGLCGILAGSLASAATSGALLFREDGDRIARDRARRTQLQIANQVLGYHRLRLEAAAGAGLVMKSPTGRASWLTSFAEVWSAAERFSGRKLDPLDAGLLAFLKANRAASV